MHTTHCDIVIVGGGYTGATIARALARSQPAVQVCLVEEKKLAHGFDHVGHHVANVEIEYSLARSIFPYSIMLGGGGSYSVHTVETVSTNHICCEDHCDCKVYLHRLYSLYPPHKPSTLHILDNSHVSKVLFEGDKAVGVVYTNQVNCGCGTSSEYYVRASKAVVLATGKSSDELLKASGVINAQAIQVVETRVQGILEKLSQLLDRLKVVESSLASAVARKHHETSHTTIKQYHVPEGIDVAVHRCTKDKAECGRVGCLFAASYCEMVKKEACPTCDGEQEKDGQKCSCEIRSVGKTCGCGEQTVKRFDGAHVAVNDNFAVVGTKGLKVASVAMWGNSLGTDSVWSRVRCGEKCAQILANELGLKLAEPRSYAYARL